MPLEKTRFKPDKISLTRRTVHFISHQPGEAFLLLRMAMWVAFLSLTIKYSTLPRVLSLIAIAPRGMKPQHPQLTQERLAQLVDALLNLNFLCFTPICWKRAPVLQRYLALSGIQTRIVFGVRKEEDASLSGHAWLEADGQPLLEATQPQYTPTYSFPA